MLRKNDQNYKKHLKKSDFFLAQYEKSSKNGNIFNLYLIVLKGFI